MGSERRMKILLSAVVLAFVFTFLVVYVTLTAVDAPRDVLLLFALPVLYAVFVVIRWAWRVMGEFLDKVL